MSVIWHKASLTAEEVQEHCNVNMQKELGIVFTEVGEDYMEATMPVSDKTTQPQNILHGGASCVLAETVGSVASNFVIDFNQFVAVGLSINASHLRPAPKGETVKATAIAEHIGSKTHIWTIKIINSKGKAICLSRLTMAIIEKTGA